MFVPKCVRLFTISLVATVSVPCLADSPDVGALLRRAGIAKGVCAVPKCGAGELANAIARRSEFLVHAFDSDQEAVAGAIATARRTGLYPGQIVVERLPINPLPYADNFVDLVVLDEPAAQVTAAEVARVLRPRGCALIRGHDALTASLERHGFRVEDATGGWRLSWKPAASAVDDWSHWYHAPDNNPVSRDAQIQAPYLTHWLGAPYYHAMPVISTVAAGRLFIASGHIAHHDREIPTLNTLVARNGYNGRVLWQRPLPTGYLVHRSAFVATEKIFYLVDGQGLLCLDPETGNELDRLEFPDIKGTLMWIAKVGDTLYMLAGANDPPADILKVRSQGRGWGWNQVDKNYSPRGRDQIRWGFGETLASYDLTGKRLLWKHEQPGMDSRGMGILGNKIFYYVPARRLACLDRETGKSIWINEDQNKLALIEKESHGLPGTPGFRTSAMLLATPVGLFIQGQKRMNVLGFSVDDGRFLWAKRKFHNNPNMVYVNEKLLISGVDRNGAVQVIDPATGKTLENFNFSKGSCARMTGSPEALYCRGEGLGRYDFATKVYSAERTARPGCNDGAIPANGLLYVGPWLCDCNLSMLGQMALGPAGGFDAQSQHLTSDNLDWITNMEAGDTVGVDSKDWPAYRANNQRTASSEATVPSAAGLLWQCELSTDRSLQAQVVTAAGYAFAAGEDGIVRCLDAKKGTTVWNYPTGGPVLASPTIWEGRTYVGSGDGYVYCLDAARGSLLWRFRVAPVERRIMVYGRIASTWPVNSGVLVHDGVAYAAAGIMFRDGTHVVAIDALTGKLKWHNGSTGKPINDQFELQAASALGTLAIGRNRLWLASGNVVAPVSFDLATGASRVVSAVRIPEWNAVMAQKPEPAGRDIMVFADRFVLHGGRLLYSGEGPVVSSAQFSFRGMDEHEGQLSPAFTPVRYCAIAPAWDHELFVMPTSRYGEVLGWRVADVDNRLSEALDTMVKMDKDIPGDNPQKWGQYNLIGRVFRAVERHLRSTSRWPVVRENVFALAVAKNAVVMTVRGQNPAATPSVAAYTKDQRKEIWKVNLPAEPRLGGLSIGRDGNVLVTLVDGSIVCAGQ